MTPRIMVDIRSFRLGTTGPSTGGIWIALGDVEFPTAAWNDFIVVILDALVAAVVRLARGHSQVERVHFMDGPYEMEVARRDQNLLQMRALARGVEKASAEVHTRELQENVLAVAEAVVDAARRAGDTSSDAARLAQGVVAMRIEIGRMSN